MTTARNKRPKYGLRQLEKDFGPLTFARLLESHRLAEDLTQSQLAKKLRISRQKLNDFEHGRRFPSLRMAADFAEALGEHAPTWVSVVIEEMLRREDLDFRVTLAG
ncbi:MAG: XRE family transcriptional regulator [Bdellovibrio sp.]|nr:MAG: XRE family transcriptional regulator [Bdellovibrio sp.]